MANTPNLQSGKTLSAQRVRRLDVTIRPCLRRSQRVRFQCLDLESGQTPEWREAEALISLGACTTPNISEQHSGAGVCSLSQILEEEVPGKYFLSPKACAGILRRAEFLGRELPPLLSEALEKQAEGGGGKSPGEVYCIAGNTINRKPENGGHGIGCQRELSYTLTTKDRHAVAAPVVRLENRGKARLCHAGEAQAVSSGRALPRQEEKTGRIMEYGVRHLTPLEWERLQAFPDGWTSHGHDGKRISETKRHEMLGNSIAIPCAAYIMQGMSQILAGYGRAA